MILILLIAGFSVLLSHSPLISSSTFLSICIVRSLSYYLAYILISYNLSNHVATKCQTTFVCLLFISSIFFITFLLPLKNSIYLTISSYL